MQNYQENKTPYDVVLIAGLDEQRIPAHRGVLSAASEVFAAMLLGNFQEAGEEEVTLGEISGADLQFLVQFCYTGKVQLSESSVDSVKTLLSAADCFQLDDLVRYCDTFLTRHLNHSNCLGIAEIAELHNCDGLAITSSYYISQHFLKVCENQEFVEISAEQLAKLLACDDLNVSSEEDVFNALLVWLKGEFKHRKKFIPTLLGLIRLHRLNPEFIISKVKPLCESVNCKDLVSQALEWHRWPNRSAMRLSQKPRRWNAGRLITVGYDCAGGEKRYVVDAYCFRTKKWTFVAENNENHFNCGIAFNGNGIMFMGGSCGTQHRNNVNCLNLATKDLRMLPPMRSDRAEFCSAELNGFVYAIGGRNMNSVERFGKGIWTEEPPMSTRRYEAGAVVFQGDLVVIGGRNGDNYHNSVERYDPWTRKWSFLAPMVKRRADMAVIATKNHIYALGGKDESLVFRCVERYDPKTNAWKIVASLNHCAGRIGATLLGEKILCINRYNSGFNVEEFDPENNKSCSFEWISSGYQPEWRLSYTCNLMAVFHDKNNKMNVKYII